MNILRSRSKFWKKMYLDISSIFVVHVVTKKEEKLITMLLNINFLLSLSISISHDTRNHAMILS
jgi:hypothetical protein